MDVRSRAANTPTTNIQFLVRDSGDVHSFHLSPFCLCRSAIFPNLVTILRASISLQRESFSERCFIADDRIECVCDVAAAAAAARSYNTDIAASMSLATDRKLLAALQFQSVTSSSTSSPPWRRHAADHWSDHQ